MISWTTAAVDGCKSGWLRGDGTKMRVPSACCLAESMSGGAACLVVRDALYMHSWSPASLAT